MVVVNENKLLIEELTDLLFDLNDLWKLQQEITFSFDEMYMNKLKHTISVTTTLCSILSSIAGDNKTKEDFLIETSNFLIIDGHFDVRDIYRLTLNTVDKIKKIENNYYDKAKMRSSLVTDYLHGIKMGVLDCEKYIKMSEENGF